MLEGSFGLIETKTLWTAAELGLADALAAGPLTTDELATRVGADPDALGRLLRLLTSIGYFAPVGRDRWQNNPTSELLRADHPDSMRAWVLFFGSDWVGEIWDELPTSVRTGRLGHSTPRSGSSTST